MNDLEEDSTSIMTDFATRIIDEVERIVASPYPPILHDLKDLITHSSPCPLNKWACSKPCHLTLLASVVLEQFPRSSAAVILLRHLAHVKGFRDSLLDQNPRLLDQILRNAADDGDAEASAVDLCVTLLSSTIPQSVLLPAQLDSFVAKLIEKMVDNPCTGNIRPVYQVFFGLLERVNLFDILSSKTMNKFQVACIGILRNLNNNMGNMLCLAMFARISTAWTPTMDHNNVDVAPLWLQNIRQFFGPKRAPKTLDLVFLCAVMACSHCHPAWSPEDAVHCVRLASEICGSIEPQQKEAWSQSNTPKIAKLCEKILRHDIDFKLQMMGITFLITLLPISRIPDEVKILCQRRLLEGDCNDLWAIESMIERGMLFFDEPTIYGMIQYAFLSLESGASENGSAIMRIKFAILLVKTLQKSKPQPLASSLVGYLSCGGSEMLQRFLRAFPIEPYKQRCHGSEICYSALSTLQNDLFIELLTLCFATPSTLPVCPGNSEITYPHAIDLLPTFMAQVKGKLPRYYCSFSQQKIVYRSDPFLLSTTTGIMETASENGASENWREKIAGSLIHGARLSHKSVIQAMEEICHDLEHRCDGVESPLREAVEQRDKLSLELEALKKYNKDLESQIGESSQLTSDLNHDMAILKKKVKVETARADNLATCLSNMEKQFESKSRESHERANSERERARSRELDLMTTLTEKEDQLDIRQEELQIKTRENESLIKNIDAISKEKVIALAECAQWMHEINRLQNDLKEQTILCADRGENIKILESEKTKIVSNNDELQKKYEQEISEMDELKSAWEVEKERHESEVATLNQKLHLEFARAKSNTEQHAARHSEELDAMRALIKVTETAMSKELQLARTKIRSLEGKVESLRRERTAKAREFSEARNHISHLMNIMDRGDHTEDNQITDRIQRRASKSRPECHPDARAQIVWNLSSVQKAPSLSPSIDQRSSGQLNNIRSPQSVSGWTCGDESPQDEGTRSSQDEVGDWACSRRPLREVDRNSPSKSSRRSLKESGADNRPDKCGSPVESNAENYFDDVEWESEGGDIFTSTLSQ